MNQTYMVIMVLGDEEGSMEEYVIATNLSREAAESLRDNRNAEVLASGMKLSEMRYAYRNAQ